MTRCFGWTVRDLAKVLYTILCTFYIPYPLWSVLLCHRATISGCNTPISFLISVLHIFPFLSFSFLFPLHGKLLEDHVYIRNKWFNMECGLGKEGAHVNLHVDTHYAHRSVVKCHFQQKFIQAKQSNISNISLPNTTSNSSSSSESAYISISS